VALRPSEAAIAVWHGSSTGTRWAIKVVALALAGGSALLSYRLFISGNYTAEYLARRRIGSAICRFLSTAFPIALTPILIAISCYQEQKLHL
jgi:hypothetical protein